MLNKTIIFSIWTLLALMTLTLNDAHALPSGTDSNESSEEVGSISDAANIADTDPVNEVVVAAADSVVAAETVDAMLVAQAEDSSDETRAAAFPKIPVIFSAFRASNFAHSGTTGGAAAAVKYDTVGLINLDGGLDVKTGVFTVKTAGIYQLAFSSYSATPGTQVMMQKGSTTIATTHHTSLASSCSDILIVVQLKVGDKISVEVRGGTISGATGKTVTFSGVLLATV